MAGIVLYSLVTAYLTGLDKVAAGHIPEADLLARLPGWTLYVFVILTPFAMFLAILPGIALWFFLSRFRLNSMFLFVDYDLPP